jgi:hypothetical protein
MSSDIAGVAAVMTNPLEQLSRLRQSRAFGPQLDRVLAQDPIVTPNTLLQSHLTWETTPRIIKLNGFPQSPAQVSHLKMSPDSPVRWIGVGSDRARREAAPAREPLGMQACRNLMAVKAANRHPRHDFFSVLR